MPRLRLSYANVMSTAALFVALGGVSYAAVAIPKNSVGARQLKTHAVTSGKLAIDAVTGSKVKDASITGQDIKLSTLGDVPKAKRAEQADWAGIANSATQATSAGRADSAATADRAGTADRADTAASADTLDGVTAAALRVRCPAGTFVAFGLCVQADAHPAQATYPAARQTCSDEGGRMPTWYELDALRQQPGLAWAAGNGANQYEWTSTVASAASRKVLALEQSGIEYGSGAGGDASATLYYRCVVQPSNG